MFERKIKKDYLNLAKITYGGEFYLELENYKLKELNIDNSKFIKVTDTLLKQKGNNNFYSYKSQSGFAANIFENINNHTLVIAYRGTERPGLGENVSDAASFIKDIISDTNLMIGNIDEQFLDAWKFYKLTKTQNPKSKIIIVGQSLGGALAQIIGAKEYTINRNKIETYTYNAPGCSHLLDIYDCNTKFDYSFITNYSVMNDWCGMFGEHIGKRYLILPIKLNEVDKNNQTEVLKNILLTTHEGIFDYTEKSMGKVIKKPKNYNQAEGLSLWYFDENNPLKDFKSSSDYARLSIPGFNIAQTDFLNETINKAKEFIKNNTPEFIKNSNMSIATENATDNSIQTQTEQTEKFMNNSNNNVIISALRQLDDIFAQLSEETLNNALKIVKREMK